MHLDPDQRQMTVQDIPTIAPNCGDCPIRHRAVCARCETDELARLEEIKYYRSFEAGQTVIWSGDRMDFVASVVTGVATLTQVMEDGRTQMVGLLRRETTRLAGVARRLEALEQRSAIAREGA